MQTFAKYWLYPSLWLWMVACLVLISAYPQHTTSLLALKSGVIVIALLFFEWRTPLRHEWGFTWRYFLRRDLVMIIVNGATIALLNLALLLLAIQTATTADGVMAGQPIWLQVIVGLLAFESLQYAIHRSMHAEIGPITRFLWRSHAIHHLPQQLYVIMHAVFHPINALAVRLLVQLTPIWLLGFDTQAVVIYGSIIGLHGTVSHLNIDMRLGWLNYVFVGPELHRYHHSARAAEAVNFGAALSVFDQVLGTFHYDPHNQPRSLGLFSSDGYPGQTAPLAALAFPFRSHATPTTKPVQPPISPGG